MLVMIIGCMEYGISQKSIDVDGLTDAEDSLFATEDTGAPSEPSADNEPSETIEEVDPEEIASELVYVQTKSALFSWHPDDGLSFISYFLDWESETPYITIAIDMLGRMYGGIRSPVPNQPEQCRADFYVELEERLYGLAFTSDGRLFGAGDGLYVVDIESGELSPFYVDHSYQTSGDIVGLPDGRLYWTVNGSDPSSGDDLVIVDPNTGNSVNRGAIGQGDIWGIGYYDGELIGFSNDGNMLSINPFDASIGSKVGFDESWWGATTNPVRW